MKKKSPVSDLQTLILEAELKKTYQEEELKQEFEALKQRLHPAQLLKSALNHLQHSPEIRKQALPVTAGLAAGYLSRKILVRKKSGFLVRIIGSLLQLAVTNAVRKKVQSSRATAEVE